MPRRRLLSTFTRVVALAAAAWFVARRRSASLSRQTGIEAPAVPADVDESSAIAAHDIRSPLTAVVGYSARLRDAVASGTLTVSEQRAEEIRLLSRAAERLQDGILGMADLEELGRGTLTPDVEPVRLSRLVQQEADRIRRWHPALPVSLDAAEVVVESDERLVRRIVRTLLENAVKHAGADRPLEVALQGLPSGGGAISVRDYGPGVPLELRAGLFERRYILNGNAMHRAGLGLHLASRLAIRLGGELAFEPVETGAAFTLTLPEACPEA